MQAEARLEGLAQEEVQLQTSLQALSKQKVMTLEPTWWLYETATKRSCFCYGKCAGAYPTSGCTSAQNASVKGFCCCFGKVFDRV